VRAHPYLEAVARLQAQVEAATSAAATPDAPVPRWDEYVADFAEGVPLLHSEGAGVDLAPIEGIVRAAMKTLAAQRLPANLADELRVLEAELQEGPLPMFECLMGESGADAPGHGLLRYLGWTGGARYLRPVVRSFERWRDEDRWMRPQCPTCGSAPAMAQLLGADPARVRFFVCGRCATRWRTKRTLCPFCETDAPRLTIMAIEGEPHLRIDCCESCRGYLKSYVGEGDEGLFLSDWSSLHLDVMAVDRGLERLAGSLYQLPHAPS
jgi:FdhE protein